MREHLVGFIIMLVLTGLAGCGAASPQEEEEPVLSESSAVCATGRPTGLAPSGVIYNDRPTFRWTAVPDCPYYTLYVQRVVDGSVVLGPIYTAGTSYRPTTPLQREDEMRWKVKCDPGPPCTPGPYSNPAKFIILEPCKPPSCQ